MDDSGEFATVEGHALASVREIVVTAGESLPVDAVILTGGRIRVTVEDPDGETAAIGRLDLLDQEGERIPVRFIRVTERGWTTALSEPGPALLGRPVAPGRYRLRLEREGKVVEEREVDVAPGRTTELTIRLPR